jgi:glutamyl-tRNA reductase
LNRYSVIAFNHHSSSLKKLEKLFADEGNLHERLALIKKELKADGLMYLATCNRMEFILSSPHLLNEKSVLLLLQVLHPEWNDKDVDKSAPLARL